MKYEQFDTYKATKLDIYIRPNLENWDKLYKTLDKKRAGGALYYNRIVLRRRDNGWLYSAPKPLRIQKSSIEPPETLIEHVNNVFISDSDSYGYEVVFSFPTINKKDEIVEMPLFADNDFIILRGADWCAVTDYPGFENANKNVLQIHIFLDLIKKIILKRIEDNLAEFDNNIESASNYWSKKYLFKSDMVRRKELAEFSGRRREYILSEEFKKVVFAKLSKSKTTVANIIGYPLHINPEGKIKYSHKYNMDWFSDSVIVGATHTFETEFFTIEITQGE